MNDGITLKEHLDRVIEESKTLSNALEVEKRNRDSQNIRIKKLESVLQDIRKDLELQSPRYGETPTRQLARDAFNQSTASANWESLKDHPEIKTIHEEITKARKHSQRGIDTLTRRLDNERPANEVFEELTNHPLMIVLKSDIKKANDHLTQLDSTLDTQYAQIRKHDFEQRDNISDLQQVQELFEFKISEMNDMFMNGFLFTIGAFATLGYEKVGEGIREILRPSIKERGKTETTKG